jgi:hypothetical protein
LTYKPTACNTRLNEKRVLFETNFAAARTILERREYATTRYFRDNKSAGLHEIFRPIVPDSMAEGGARRYYWEVDQ